MVRGETLTAGFAYQRMWDGKGAIPSQDGV